MPDFFDLFFFLSSPPPPPARLRNQPVRLTDRGRRSQMSAVIEESVRFPGFSDKLSDASAADVSAKTGGERHKSAR